MPVDGIEIRQAEPTDDQAVLAAMQVIHAETEFLGRPGEYVDHWASQISRASRDGDFAVYFLATAGGEIVGYIGAVRESLRRLAGKVFIRHVGLRASRRGLGTGSRLFAAVEAWAAARNAYRLELGVEEENPRAFALYRRLGFRDEGKVPRSFVRDGQLRTIHWMGKPLRAVADETLPESDLAPSARGRGRDGILFRLPRAEDAAALGVLDLALLAEAPWGLTDPDELPTEEKIREGLIRRLSDPGQTMQLATTGEGAEERILGVVRAGCGPGPMAHDIDASITVLREAWGRGIGLELAAHLERWAGEKGARRLTTYVTRQNLRGVRFAENLGFRREVLMPAWSAVDGRSVDRLRMGKLID